MKYLLILVALIATIGCTNSNPKPGPIVTPTPIVVPTPTPAPTPVVTAEKGKWCNSDEPDFSPATPAFDTSVACKPGLRQAGGGSIWYCREVCPYAFNLGSAIGRAHLNSSTLKITRLDGTVETYPAILPSPMPPVVPVIEVVEKADGIYLK